MGSEFRRSPGDEDARTAGIGDDGDGDRGRLAAAELLLLSLETGEFGGQRRAVELGQSSGPTWFPNAVT